MKKILSLLLVCLFSLSLVMSACADDYAYTVSAPTGAPGIALATLAVENPDAYTYLAADTITAEFANNTTDFVIAPLNAGAKLFKAGKSTYKLGAVITWGNLYFASQKENFSLEDMNDATVTLFGENTINASVALFALEKNGIVPASIEYLAGAANTQSLLLSDENAIVLTAEPALTAASLKNDRITGIAVNDLYKEATGFDGYTQAALFIREETCVEHPEVVKDFLALVQESCDKVESDLDAVVEASVALEILPNAKVASLAIPKCNIRFLAALDAKEQIETTAGIDLAQFGGDVPADDFYYEAE